MSIEFQKEESTEEVEQVYIPVTPVTPYFTYILVASIVAVAVVQMATNLELSILLAGFDKVAFGQYGEYWRILTGAALHGSFAHIAFNGYALLMLGKLVETISNRAHIAIVFLLSVIGGGILSFVFAPEATSVGASGGIIGLLGYLTVYGIYRRKLLSNAFLKNMVFNIGFIAILGVVVLPLLGAFGVKEVPRIDNFGHLGGLLAGAIYGAIQIPRDLYKDPREVGEIGSLFGFAALGIFVFVSILTILLIFRIISL